MSKILGTVFNFRCHKETFTYIFFNAVVSLLPLVAAFLFVLFDKWQGWSIFWSNGELYIYSAVFFASSLYTLTNLGNLKRSYTSKFLLLIIILGIALAIVGYAGIVSSTISDQNLPPNPEFLKKSSLVLATISLIIFYIVTYWEKFLQQVVNGDFDRDDIEDLKEKIKK